MWLKAPKIKKIRHANVDVYITSRKWMMINGTWPCLDALKCLNLSSTKKASWSAGATCKNERQNG